MTPEITIGPPIVAELIPVADARVTVTELLRSSLIAVMADDWLGPTFGNVNVVVLPIPVLVAVNEVMMSASPLTTLPALATKTRELFGRMAAWVGLIPMLVVPMLLSPATSICNAVPGLGATLVLIPKTAWKLAGFGGLLAIGI